MYLLSAPNIPKIKFIAFKAFRFIPMNPLILSLCLIICLCIAQSTSFSNGASVPFLNVYMKSFNSQTKQTVPFYWGPSGKFEFYQSAENPSESLIQVTFPSHQTNNTFLLNSNEIHGLQSFVKYAKIVEFVVLSFPAKQIALSEDSKYCGLFSDEEYTFDIDMPINPIGKDESSHERLEFSFVFDLKYEDQMNQIYSFLEHICQLRIKD